MPVYMTAEDFARLAQEVVGEKKRGRGAWVGLTAEELGVSSTAVRNYAKGRTAISNRLAKHVRLWHGEHARKRTHRDQQRQSTERARDDAAQRALNAAASRRERGGAKLPDWE